MDFHNFKFRCYRNLKKNLGEIDAIVECSELAIREFVYLSNNSQGNDYIKQKSYQHCVKVDSVDCVRLVQRNSKLHILNVYGQFEWFLKCLKKEHPEGGDWNIDNDKKSLFSKTLKCLSNKEIIIISDLEQDLIEYYRGVRNSFIHIDGKGVKNWEVKSEDLRKRVLEDVQLKKYKAPNKFDEIQFDDFLLFTNIVKAVSLKMSVLGKPSDDLIVQMIKKFPKFNDIKKFKNNPRRAENALKNLIRTEYCMSFEESKFVVESILKEILA